MAESLSFKIAPRAAYESQYSTANWYQSLDGIEWIDIPVDTAIISSLAVSGENYIWDSMLATSDLYNMLKFTDTDGEILDTKLIIPPRYILIHSALSGLSLNNNSKYSPGETIDLMFRLNDSAIPQIGDVIRVEIVTQNGIVLETLYANRVGSLYYALWEIPLNINEKLISLNEYGNYEDIILYDKWNLIKGSLQYPISISRTIESPIENNSIIHVALRDIADEGNVFLTDTVFTFTTYLTPMYASVHDVKYVGIDTLIEYDDYSILNVILNVSRYVDSNMKPDMIYRENAYNIAVKNYVILTAALFLLKSKIQKNLEEKQLDAFRYKYTTGDPKTLIDSLEKDRDKYALFIWAGGKDTPFTTKTFEKGLYDPNRPVLSHSKFQSDGWFPFLNSTMDSYIANVNGNNIEIRGERVATFKYITNRYSGLLSVDNGDVGYLSRI
jgi:hypothetical protein